MPSQHDLPTDRENLFTSLGIEIIEQGLHGWIQPVELAQLQGKTLG